MESRFVDTGNDMVKDNETGLVWSRQDSWQILHDYLDFQEALTFVDDMNKKDFLGQHDWRIAEKDEIEKLYLPGNIIVGRSNQELNLHSAFAPGGGNGSWCLPFDQRAAFYYSYSSGLSQNFDQDFSQGYVRLVRLYPD